MNIEIGLKVECKDNSLKKYIDGESYYGKTLEVAKVYENEIYLHNEDKTDYYVITLKDILKELQDEIKKYEKLETSNTRGTN